MCVCAKDPACLEAVLRMCIAYPCCLQHEESGKTCPSGNSQVLRTMGFPWTPTKMKPKAESVVLINYVGINISEVKTYIVKVAIRLSLTTFFSAYPVLLQIFTFVLH